MEIYLYKILIRLIRIVKNCIVDYFHSINYIYNINPEIPDSSSSNQQPVLPLDASSCDIIV